ncbi:MAG: M20/M25/M40 family metallo-hydrolase, partial [Clostridia bacterium]
FSVRLVLGCDEEVGSTDLEYFKSVRKPPMFSFTPDHKYPVCIGEKGIMTFTYSLGKAGDEIVFLKGGSVSNAVADSAQIELRTKKSPISNENITVFRDNDILKITAVGKTAHASTPETSVNAIALLADFLLENELLPQENIKAFEFLSKAENEYLGKTLSIDFHDKYFGYLTCVGGVLALKNGEITINFNVRYPMSKSFDEVYENVVKTAENYGFNIIFSNRGTAHSVGYFKSPDSPEIKALTKAAEDVLCCDCKPYTMGGGTYARALPNTVAFGAEMDKYKGLLGEGKGEAHDRDEYLTEEEFFGGIKIFVNSIISLGKIYE